MNILHILWSRSGKMALSAMQAVGLSAAVGVAGIAAWQMLGSSEDVNPNTVFSSGSDEQIVYVAGGGAGGYGGISYGEGGEVRSGIRAKMSKDMQLMQSDFQHTQTAGTEIDRREQHIDAYKMDGASEGLGMGKNAAHEKALGGGDMSALQAQMAAMQKGLAARQQEAASAAASGAGTEGSAEAAAAAALGKQGKGGSGRYGMNSDVTRASGHDLGATPLQAGGPGSRRGGTLGGGRVGGRSAGPMADGSTLTPKFEGGRDAAIRASRNLNGRDTLLGYVNTSKRIAENRNRSVVDAASMFLANQKLSGGIMLNGENVNTGTGATSADFSDPDFSGLNSAMGAAQEEIGNYADDKLQLQKDLKSFAKKASWCSAIPVLGIVLGYGLCAPARKDIKNKVQAFKAKWGETDYETSNTHGAFWGHAQDSYRDIYNAIGFTGIPWAVYKRDAKKIWNANDEGETEEREDGDVRSPFGSSYAQDALQVGSIGCGY